ncbi:BlaI/MecI/CopY family transcriptional regulator [Yinghuangia sp. ASG 101]|uniref:BlaI/MecI/CopY family transcriptional regulator n=1 Tax=Yinghuangia sp. ASG 101 TaxID=2896848 RepID=UPI001E3DB5FC|nr:BlaI/MecI/CopY family transcriptional regulator [Yinghuangia sp. ASG 101]UGQ09193.1 BlaI/MecI/CopY family transcriptional regulator [Yinghuangia sp. ASG 101]
MSRFGETLRPGGTPRFGALEEQVMLRLWAAAEPLAVRDVRAALLPERKLAYTTVMTVLDNLYRKGMLSRHPVGRAFHYEPVLSREAHTAALMREDWLSGGGRAGALVHFVEGMSPEQVDALRDALRVALPGEDERP